MIPKVIEIPYLPHQFQKVIHEDSTRYKVIVWHRQAGKTTLAINEMIRQAAVKPGKYFYIAPTYRQAKEIAWEMLKFYCPKVIVDKINENELAVWLINGSKISLKSAKEWETLRGVTLQGVIFDEFQNIEPAVWQEAIYPTMSKTDGWAIFIGTPRGKGYFFELFCQKSEDWKSWKLSAYESGLLSKEVLENARRELPDRVFRQEFGADFQDDAGSVFTGVKFCVKGGMMLPESGHAYQMGVDLGKSEDFTVITVLDLNLNHVVWWERINERDWAFIRARIEAVSRRFNNCLARIDVSGAGSPLVEDLIRQGVNVEAFIYTEDSKKQLVENLIILIQDQRISFPPIEVLVNELEIFTFEITSGGRVKYNAPKGFHDDAVHSLGLACWQIEPIPQNTHSDIYLPKFTSYN